MTNIKQFTKELAELMEKHEVKYMGGAYEGDSHGIYDENFYINVTDGSPWGKDIKICNTEMDTEPKELRKFSENA